MHKLVLVRHGESTWNKENLFTGWTDVDFQRKVFKKPQKEVVFSGAGYIFDIAFTSVFEAGDTNPLDRHGRDGSHVDPRDPGLAPERTALRRSARP